MDKLAIRRKQRARKLLIQAIYQWLLSQAEPSEIAAQFYAINDMSKVDTEHFDKLIKVIPKEIDNLNALLMQFIDRNLNELNPVEHAVLLLGAYELKNCPETPYKIILDETILLNKTFGAQEGHKYVNGVLNSLAKTLRPHEGL